MDKPSRAAYMREYRKRPQLTTAEFANTTIAAVTEPTVIRRYKTVIGTYYPVGTEPDDNTPPLVPKPRRRLGWGIGWAAMFTSLVTGLIAAYLAIEALNAVSPIYGYAATSITAATIGGSILMWEKHR